MNFLNRRLKQLITFSLLVVFHGQLHAYDDALKSKNKNLPTLRIAVAANFSQTLSQLSTIFTRETGINIQIIIGSTGHLSRQIQFGAPFDIFIAADKYAPQLILDKALALNDSMATYAFGAISFWSKHWQSTEKYPNINEIFQSITKGSSKLAMANPMFSPYGLASQQALEENKVWNKINKKRLIIGVNVNQTFQQIRSGAVPIGIIANSQLKYNQLKGVSIPRDHYRPIEQKLVILKSSKQPQFAKQFVHFLLAKKSQHIISSNGYVAIASDLNEAKHD